MASKWNRVEILLLQKHSKIENAQPGKGFQVEVLELGHLHPRYTEVGSLPSEDSGFEDSTLYGNCVCSNIQYHTRFH